MSAKTFSRNIYSKTGNPSIKNSTLYNAGENGRAGNPRRKWKRNPNWPDCDLTSSDEAVKILVAVYPDLVNHMYIYVQTGSAGTSTIDWGDSSSTESVTSSVSIGHSYSYTDSALDGTNAPVTFTASTDTVNRTGHGYEDGDFVNFYNLTTTTGISEHQSYYVINSTANTFQVSLTEGGSAVTLTNDGSATLLPYKIATMHLTVDGSDTLSSVNFGYLPSGFPAYNYTWAVPALDIAVSGSTLAYFYNMGSLSQNAPRKWTHLERVQIFNTASGGINLSYTFSYTSLKAFYLRGGNINTLRGTFYQCPLEIISDLDVSNCSDFYQAFYTTQITSAPKLNFSPTLNSNCEQMFQYCTYLETVPFYDFGNATNIKFIFRGCQLLKSIPGIKIRSGYNVAISSIFYDCVNLEVAPSFDTSSCTDFSNLFFNCESLKRAPNLDTGSAQTFFNTFANSGIVEIPNWDYSTAANFTGTFSGCNNLDYVPPMDFSSATSLSQTFSACRHIKYIGELKTSASLTNVSNLCYFNLSLVSAPILTNTSNVAIWSYFLRVCPLVKEIPVYDLSSATDVTRMFEQASSLKRIPAIDFSNVTNFGGSSGLFYYGGLERIDATGIAYTFSLQYNNLSGAELDRVYTNLPTVTGQTVTVTQNFGIADDDPSIATAKGWTVTG